MDAYAAAYLTDGSPLAADADHPEPLPRLRLACRRDRAGPSQGRGVYVLALTSNPEGPQVQHARVADGRWVAQMIIDEAARHNPGRRLGSVGLVVGATIGRTEADFSGVNGSILAPGLGAQGGRPPISMRCSVRRPVSCYRAGAGSPGGRARSGETAGDRVLGQMKAGSSRVGGVDPDRTPRMG